MVRTLNFKIGLAMLVFAVAGLLLAGPVMAADEAHTAVEAAHGAGGEHGGEAHGNPELIAKPSAGIIPAITTLVIFVLLLVVLSKFAWGPIVSGLKAREDKIRKDIEEAEAARARAEATLRDYTAQLNTAEAKVREMISNAAAEGERVAAGIRTHAQQESEEIKERAHRDIESAKNQAISEIYEQTATLATTVAEKILRKNLTAEDQRELVNRSLEQLQGLNKN